MKFKDVEVGSVVVHKCTGAYATVIGTNDDTQVVAVRMAENIDAGTKYVKYDFIPEELETVEAHLRRNLKEMELKQALLQDAKQRQKEKELEELDVPEAVN